MARLRALLASALLAASFSVASADPVLQCKKEIAGGNGRSTPPSDVAVDGKGRAYVLYEGDGFLDIYDESGRLLQHRGGESERENQLTHITPLSLWVGRQGRTALLVSEPHQQIARAALVVSGNEFVTVPLRGSPEPMSGPSAVARDLEGHFYVWVQSLGKVYSFDGNGHYSGSTPVPGLRRPVQLAIDSSGQIYCLDTSGLTVFHSDGGRSYEVAGATAFYLTGADKLAVAGRDYIRRYNHEGRLEVENRSLDLLKNLEPIAISLNDESQFFVYGRDPMSGSGLIQKLNASGEPIADFPQPKRTPAAPDPGTRIDYQGRVRFWENRTGQLTKLHPSGKREQAWGFVAEAGSLGRLAKPADVVIDGEDTAWIADAGNCRLQRFSLSKGGWQKPFTIGIQGGDARGVPRSLALGRGLIYCVVYPPRGVGNIVLQSRDRQNKILMQRTICSAQGEPVVKVACGPSGDVFLYQSRFKTMSGWEDLPVLTRFSPSFQKLAEVGADGLGMAPPGHPNQRLFLKPQEDIVPYGQGVLLATNGQVYRMNGQLQIEAAYNLQLKRRDQNFQDFAGACVSKKVLYITDIGNQCVQRALLP